MTARLFRLVAAAASIASSGATLAQAAPASWAKCSACQVAAAGKPSTIGPNLWGVVGRKAGTLPGYSFSAGMKKLGTIWTAANLDSYLVKPMVTVQGTKMIFPGLPDAKQRAEVVAYLQTLK